MEFQRSRFAARETASGGAVLLTDQDRSRWDRGQIARAVDELRRADAVAAARGIGRGPYALQAEIAQCHAVAPSVAETDWSRIVLLYEILGRVAPSPMVELNRAAAVSMTVGPAEALAIVDEVERTGALRGSHVVPSVRGGAAGSAGAGVGGAYRVAGGSGTHGEHGATGGAAREGGAAGRGVGRRGGVTKRRAPWRMSLRIAGCALARAECVRRVRVPLEPAVRVVVWQG